MTKVILPELGENITKATVSYWYFSEGDTVKEKDDLVELATDKATFNVPSPVNGKISKIYFTEGDNVSVGEVLAEIS
ncbi:MAG: biotin/lipoyl-binding protein [Candidatus Omnitrophota bacterium]|jgi:pyruvate/2-oxoglutarate dehydrogenase complex dihydrolipoamide acyltransferase (E2) component|nr:MAG: biotin/lipoyl-binding protein [Candidatus Omnitrophota bacterium]